VEYLLGVISGVVVSFIACLFWLKGRAGVAVKEKIVYMNEDEAKKNERLAKLEQYLIGHDRITNAEVEKLLGVSDATATRYLDDLQAANKLQQINAGHNTYYTKA